MDAVGQFIAQHWRQALEVMILWVIIYNTYRYFRATRGARIFTALVGIYIGMTLLSESLDLTVIGWLLKYVTVFLAIALIIIFQPELRRSPRIRSQLSGGCPTCSRSCATAFAAFRPRRRGPVLQPARTGRPTLRFSGCPCVH